MILEKLVVGPIGANCFIIGDEGSGEGVVIDPGGEAETVLKAVRSSDLKIKYVIATHGHFDHTGAVGPVIEALGCEFLMHEEDLFFARDSVTSARKWGIVVDQVPDPDRYISHGDVIEIGSIEMKVIHTPGHSPGGVSLYVEKEGALFAGDTLFQRSIGRTDFRQGSMEVLVSSIQKRIFELPPETVVYTGHGPETTVDEERRMNPFVRLR